MSVEQTRVKKIFYCYSHRDKALRDELEEHLEPLRRSGQITTWYDREIQPGMEWKTEIDKHLNTSDIVLLLVSSNFMRSDYCYGIEMRRALERYDTGETRVIPIILRAVEWKETQIGKFQALPTDGKPITLWRNHDEAFQDVVRGIRKVVEELNLNVNKKNITTTDASVVKINTKTNIAISEPKHTIGQWLKEAVAQSKARQWMQALAAYEHVTQIDPDDASSFHKMADILAKLERYEEALTKYERVIQLNHNNGTVYMKIGDILMKFQRYEDALVAFERAITYAIDDLPLSCPRADAFLRKGDVLSQLERYEEALAAYDEAIDFEQGFPMIAFLNKGSLLLELKRYEEALAAFNTVGSSGPPGLEIEIAEILFILGRYEEALIKYTHAVDDASASDLITIHCGKGKTLYNLNRYEEALAAYETANAVYERYYESFIAADSEFDLTVIYNGKGAVLQSMGRLEEAHQVHKRAAYLNSIKLR